MEIILDNRERKLFNYFLKLIEENEKFKEIKITIENLPLADVILKYNNEEKLIIERKTIADLNSSINDGRYENQSYRLNNLETHENHNIIYLIEGDLRKISYDRQKIYSSITSLSYFKGFSIIRSFDIQETAYILCNTLLKIKIEYCKGNKYPYYKNLINKENLENAENVKNVENAENVVNIENAENVENAKNSENVENVENCNISQTKDYCSVIKKSKKSSNITIDNISQIMLSQIPNVSYNTAIAIIDKYKNINNLIKELQNNKNCLNEITYNINNNKVRKINKNSIQNIIKFLQI